MKESAELPVEDSLFEMQLMDEIRQQIGLVYDADVEQKHVDWTLIYRCISLTVTYYVRTVLKIIDFVISSYFWEKI